MDDQNPRQVLAQRLRALREDRWPGRRITQPELARALGVSVPLISSWESQAKPRTPPPGRLDVIAEVFASPRSFDTTPPRAVSPQDMNDGERQAMNELKRELAQLRGSALGAVTTQAEPGLPRQISQLSRSLGDGPWRFEDGEDVTIVCAQWPAEMLRRIPYTDVGSPDYMELLTYSEPDALFELFGHLRAANPTNQVNLRAAEKLASDDWSSHLAILGGIDWNTATSEALQMLRLPVTQVADWHTEGGQYFKVEGDGGDGQFHPVLEKSGNRTILRQDVAMFARAASPFNQQRTVTICNGMYGRGTYGAVRALTDAKFRDRNAEYLQKRFGDSASYCIVSRVPIINGATLTPDWTKSDNTLFEWSE